MKDKLLQMRVDEEFLFKLEYLHNINGYKSVADTVRNIVEKEFRKENESNEPLNKISSVIYGEWLMKDEYQPILLLNKIRNILEGKMV